MPSGSHVGERGHCSVQLDIGKRSKRPDRLNRIDAHVEEIHVQAALSKRVSTGLPSGLGWHEHHEGAKGAGQRSKRRADEGC